MSKKNPVEIKIVDTTINDANQMIWSGRVRMEEIVPILPAMDEVGYYSIDAWGGGAFDACLRYLGEDPWDRLLTFKEHLVKTPLQMSLRGQSIVGYHTYPDDVLEEFLLRAIADGVDIVRIDDALNDIRNLERAIEITKREGASSHVGMCYLPHLERPMEFYVKMAKRIEDAGADAVCIKDRVGLLSPTMAEQLVKEIKGGCNRPLFLHSHRSYGLAEIVYLKGIEAGADGMDCVSLPSAPAVAQPSTESMYRILADSEGFSAPLRQDHLEEVEGYFSAINQKHGSRDKEEASVRHILLSNDLPIGIEGDLLNQIKSWGVADKLSDVVDEIMEVRRDLGSPPLVAPITQMIIMQSVLNVASKERYQRTSKEIRDYARGFYGKTPEPIEEDIRRQIIGDEKVIDQRPADLLPPALVGAAEMNIDKNYIRRREDLLSYALLPQSAVKFFAYRENPDLKEDVYGIEEASEESGNLRLVEEAIEMVTADHITELLLEDGETSLKIKRHESSPRLTSNDGNFEPQPAITPVETVAGEDARPTPYEESDDLENIVSPIVGTFYEAPSPGADPFVKVGDRVEPGHTVCIVEAMKLMNEITAEVEGRIVKVMVKDAEGVVAGQELFKIEPLG